MAAIPRLRTSTGPALLSYGFRPFFLAGALYSGAAILLWLPAFYGKLSVATAFAPRDWHVHEMLYGYMPAVLTGFLLTAIPNWTGRLPIQGARLLGLVLVWIAGRIAVTLSGIVGWPLAAAIDGTFLLLVVAAAAREIEAGRNWRNLPIVVLLAGLAAGNIMFHVEAHVVGVAEYATRLGMAIAVMLITLVGGRLVPSFTHNWLARENPGRLPVPFGRYDIVVLAASAVALAAWVVAPATPAAGAILVVAAGLQFTRLARWAGDRTARDRLVLVLHLGYAFVPLGLLLLGMSAFDVLPTAAGVHALAGAIGTMTLAVMTRASLGHTGHPLDASPGTQAIYAAVILAAFARICAAVHAEWSPLLLHVAAFAWAAAFVGFALTFGPMLVRERASRKRT
jgi:uncharacterized protein involved in response to NO